MSLPLALLAAQLTAGAPLEAEVELLTLDPLAPGARSELSLVLREEPARDLPLSLRLEVEAPGPSLIEDRLDWRSVADPLAPLPRVRAPFEAPSEPGTYEIRGQLRYWVCGERWCRVKTGALRWTIEVVALSSAGDD